MSEKSKHRKLVLRDKLVVAAEARIEHAGLASLRARDLATDARCSLEAIYNVYEDLNAVVMA